MKKTHSKHRKHIERKLRRATGATMQEMYRRNPLYEGKFRNVLSALRRRIFGNVIKLAPAFNAQVQTYLGMRGKSEQRDLPQPARCYESGNTQQKRALRNAQRECRAATARAHMVKLTRKAIKKGRRLNAGAERYNDAMNRIALSS